MPPRWNTWATVHSVQWDWEKQPKDRQVRLAAAVPQVGDPVRVRMSGVEVEGIITDAMRGSVTGMDVMRALRSDPEVAAIPIVAFTSHALRSELDAALQAGFDAVIAKPCLPDDLMRLIQPFLDGRTAA